MALTFTKVEAVSFRLLLCLMIASYLEKVHDIVI